MAMQANHPGADPAIDAVPEFDAERGISTMKKARPGGGK
jgi:hypothetical protein